MTTRPKTIECERCGAGVSVMSRGPVPRFCATCRKRGGATRISHNGSRWHDDHEAQARALRALTHATNGNGRRTLDPEGKPVVLGPPLAIDERSYEFHHRKNRVKRVAFTILWLAVALLILTLMFLGWRPVAFEGIALLFA